MMTPKKLNVAMAVALAMGAGAANAEIEISGHLKNETAFLTQSGQFIGEARDSFDKDDHHGDTLKFENSARIFINGEFGEESSWHLDLNLIYDSEGVESEYKGHELYTQNDWFKEAYIDTTWGDTDIRLGKQQVVWGTADGIKLLDIINPTDYREFSQNTFEDSRIPIWMVNIDTPIGETGSLQFILSEHEENKIPGLDKDGDKDHPYTVQGVDTITGEVNGFLHVAPALANVATTFSLAAAGGLLAPGASPAGLVPVTNLTVDTFSASTWANAGSGLAPTGLATKNTDLVQNINPLNFAADGYVLLNAMAQQGLDGLGAVPPGAVPPGLGNASVTKVLNQSGSLWDFSAPSTTTTTWDIANPTSAFEHMPNATFSTFNTFSGFAGKPFGAQTAMTTRYTRDYPDDDEGNFGVRYKDSTESGINWSVNYFYNYDPNPVVDISHHDAVTGVELQTELRGVGTLFGPPGPATPGLPDGALISRDSATLSNAGGGATVLMKNPVTGETYGAFDPDPFRTHSTGLSGNGVEMRFTETLERTHNLGGSFDMALDNFDVPLVMRGEFLYKQDEMHPVVDKRLLAIGDLEGALQPEEHDMFKYVIGLDATVMTNLLISTQFIQFRNLDYEDDDRTCTTQLAGATTLSSTFDCSRYTADAPTLSLENSLQEAEENKEFVSVFFTKPFGSEQQGRWGNITILEDEGGYWNRFDVEYGLTDNWVVSGELNSYWGDEDSWFGQLEETSNVQFGVKYIFE